MRRTALFARNYNWRMVLMRLLVNMLALLFTALLVPNIYFVDRRLGVWLLLALVLGVLNTVVKPIIQLVTLQFLFATGGLLVILINAIILWLLALIFPQSLAVNGILWSLVGGAVLGLSAAFLESLLGLTPPIVSEKYPEIRQRVKDRQFYRTQAELARIDARNKGSVLELATARALVTGASASVTQYVAPAKTGAPENQVAVPAAPEVDNAPAPEV